MRKILIALGLVVSAGLISGCLVSPQTLFQNDQKIQETPTTSEQSVVEPETTSSQPTETAFDSSALDTGEWNTTPHGKWEDPDTVGADVEGTTIANAMITPSHQDRWFQNTVWGKAFSSVDEIEDMLPDAYLKVLEQNWNEVVAAAGHEMTTEEAQPDKPMRTQHIILRYESTEFADMVAQELYGVSLENMGETYLVEVPGSYAHAWTDTDEELSNVLETFTVHDEFLILTRVRGAVDFQNHEEYVPLYLSAQLPQLDELQLKKTSTGAGELDSYPDPDPNDIAKYTLSSDSEGHKANFYFGEMSRGTLITTYTGPLAGEQVFDTGVEDVATDASTVYRLTTEGQAKHLFAKLAAQNPLTVGHGFELQQDIPGVECFTTSYYYECVLQHENYVAYLRQDVSAGEFNEENTLEAGRKIAAQYVLLEQAPTNENPHDTPPKMPGT